VDQDRVGTAYKGEQAAVYADYQLVVTSGMEAEIARRFQPMVGNDDVVLDFGCGGGGILASLDCRLRIGVEVNPHAQAAARAKGLAVESSLDEIEPGSVDVVISNHALEHCTQPLMELRRIRDVLRPGGRIVLVLPLDDWRTQRHAIRGDVNRHLYAWTPLILGNLLQEAGFAVDSVEIIRSVWPPRASRFLWERLPPRAFDMLGFTLSILLKRRQLRAVAHPAVEGL
jgi:SAM-dependent methyltransferase